MGEKRYVFGPVPSRRLGRSLGVDLVPPKTCSFDCVYCQLGRTTDLTVTRREYVPTDRVIRQIEERLGESAPPDYVTLSGSGEPTLHAAFGEIVGAVKAMTDTPVAVLTNGSLLGDPDVRAGCLGADLVVPSLDVADRRLFPCVNRPHPDIVFEDMIEGLVEFRRQFSGQIWIEILLLYGVTGVAPYVRRMLPLVERIRPDRVQLNTAVRPPADPIVRPVPPEDLRNLADLFEPTADVIAGPAAIQKQGEFLVRRDDVVALIERRPCSVEDIASGLGIHRNEAAKYVGGLLAEGRIRSESREGRTYYFAPRPSRG